MPRSSRSTPHRSTAASAERLLNLLIALLDRDGGYTRDQLRTIVPGYDRAGSDDAFERMFERDKAHLRSLGYPVEEIPDEDPWSSDVRGAPRYRVARGSYRLPSVQFSAEESAVLAVAADAWNDAAQDRLARRALEKLEPALSTEVTPGRDVQPTVAVADPAFEPLLTAVLAHRVVRFDYVDRAGVFSRRTVHPWGVGSRYGVWYLAGWDADRRALRTFRLSRIISEVGVLRERFDPPEDFSMSGTLARMVTLPTRLRVAVAVRRGAGHLLRQLAGSAPATPEDPNLSAGADAAPSGFDLVQLEVPDAETAAEHVCAAGPDAHVAPDGGGDPAVQQEVARAVRRRLAEARRFQDRVAGTEVAWGKQRRNGAAKASTEAHLARLLHIIRHVYAHQGAELAETARHFGITDQQLVADLQTLFVCGRPGHMPDQLIDASWDDGHIYLGNAQELSEPVRLTVPEASALLMGLQTLQNLPGGDNAVVRATMRKVATAADALPLADALAAPEEPRPAGTEDHEVVATVREAIAAKRRVALRYVVASRDEVTERLVDPVRIVTSDGHQYVRGWCLSANAPRTFRADRIVGCVDAGPAEAHPRLDSEARAPIQPQRRKPVHAVLVTDRRGRWIVEHFHATRSAPVELPRHGADKSVAGDARTGGPGGPRPLPEFVAAEVDFPTVEALCSLVTRHAGHVAVASPPELVSAVERWLNDAQEGARADRT